jgi:hypothetical protein
MRNLVILSLMIDTSVALLDIHPVNQDRRTCAIFE